jgi:hypothetical protein
MKKYIYYIITYLLILTGGIITSFGQTENVSNKISFALVMPNEISGGISETHLQRLHDKFVDALTENGIASLSVQNNLVLYPIIKIYNEQTVNPGLQNITVIEADISLYVKQLDSKVIFASITKKLKGSGRNRDLALSNLISNVKLDDESTRVFLERAKQKAITYYNQRCSTILAQADQMMKMNQSQEALVSLFSIPSEVECYQQTQNKAIEAFKMYQNQNCNQMLLNAKVKIANRQFEEGLGIIGMIDPSSPCKSEALLIIQQASGQVEGDNKRKWDLLNKIFVDSAEIEKRRLDLMSQFLLAYALNANRYNYQNVIR